MELTRDLEKSNKSTSGIINLNSGPWRMVVTRNMSFLHQWMSVLGHFHNSKDFGLTVGNRQLAYVVKATEASIFVPPEDLINYDKAVLEILDSSEKINDLQNKYHIFAQELIESVSLMNKNLTVINWKNFVANYTRFTAGLFLTNVIGRIGADKLIQLLAEEGFLKDQIEEILGYITFPEERTPLFQSRLDLLAIGNKIQKNIISFENANNELEEWINNHGYIPVNFCEDPWTMIDAKNQLREILEKDCSVELQEINNSHNQKIKKAKDYLNQIKNDKIRIIANGVTMGTLLNEFRKNVFSKVSLDFRKALSEIVIMFNSQDWRDCFYLTPDEISSVIAGEKIDTIKIKNGRKEISFYTSKEGLNIFLAKDEHEVVKEFVNTIQGKNTKQNLDQTQAIIKGSIANKGKVRGVARIILSAKDFDKIHSGEILVTTMTSVDFVPIMGRAAAFVTNEGGITSHAAIIAREMNKPCIIGTQNGTQIIKDGDEVEVDADQGIVKILS